MILINAAVSRAVTATVSAGYAPGLVDFKLSPVCLLKYDQLHET